MRWMLKKLMIVGLVITSGTLFGQPKPPANQPGTVLWDVGPDRGLRGLVLTAAVASERHVLLAGGSRLYLVRDGKAEVVAEPPDPNAHLVLAPGGRVYGYLVPQLVPPNLFTAQIRVEGSSKITELRPPGNSGFLALWIGYQGGLIVTVTPLGDWQALHGPYRYTFWSADGRVLNEVDRADRSTPVFDVRGEAILLLEPKAAIVFSAKGERLWELEGTYRKGALAASGAVALLNPSRAIRDIVIAGKERKSTVTVETAVHHLALADDGSTAFVAGDRGTYAFFDPNRPRLKMRPAPLLDNPYIFGAEFLTRDSVALAILHRSGGKQPAWPRGSYAAIDRGGKLLFARTFEVEQPATASVGVATLYGSPYFIGFNDSRALLARVNP